MRTTQQLSITLPNDMSDMIKAKVRTGEYASESEVIRDGLRTLLERDRAVESWLHQQVGPAYDALKADPSRAVTGDQVRGRLAAEHAKALFHCQIVHERESGAQTARMRGERRRQSARMIWQWNELPRHLLPRGSGTAFSPVPPYRRCGVARDCSAVYRGDRELLREPVHLPASGQQAPCCAPRSAHHHLQEAGRHLLRCERRTGNHHWRVLRRPRLRTHFARRPRPQRHGSVSPPATATRQRLPCMGAMDE